MSQANSLVRKRVNQARGLIEEASGRTVGWVWAEQSANHSHVRWVFSRAIDGWVHLRSTRKSPDTWCLVEKWRECIYTVRSFKDLLQVLREAREARAKEKPASF